MNTNELLYSGPHISAQIPFNAPLTVLPSYDYRAVLSDVPGPGWPEAWGLGLAKGSLGL